MTVSTRRSFALRTAVGCVAVFASVRLALARDGVAGGAARSFVTVAGTVRGVTGAAQMVFRFRRPDSDGGAPVVACEPSVLVSVVEGGAFSAEVPLDNPTTRCPADLFDGRDVSVALTVNGAPIEGTFLVNPVPYAVHADVASAAAGPLQDRIATLEHRVQSLEAAAAPAAYGSGTFSSAATDIVLRRSALFPSGYRYVTSRAVLLTVRTSGEGVEHTVVWLVVTGGQSGAVVQLLVNHRYVGVSAVDVVPNRDQGVFTTDDIEQGITIRLVNFPTTRANSWSFTATPIDLLPM